MADTLVEEAEAKMDSNYLSAPEPAERDSTMAEAAVLGSKLVQACAYALVRLALRLAHPSHTCTACKQCRSCVEYLWQMPGQRRCRPYFLLVSQ